ncbi:hypothetical protein NEAUS04_0787 [Nematocida ausubeli]|uniref:Uncharacterized protein n=1 Tax=Nematocida ausubeli (strain ATCC PRA-371 / ERTm2) TaxID=1913371 RepID=A0A086J4D6_NEMA1|nr:uncharacterized protein NESG_00075 [Nematocida ausubeli]KAI5161949.1 hypothetical protein NEAUS04_0787 [Nematocida ausubeli]KFG27004.1 hypothetical protein NESG_00075 [Nematocida ausubeli]
MVVLNSLKILSSGIRHSLTVQYRPSDQVRKAFILPQILSVHVEIFPISEISVFSMAEPLYFIDGYLIAEDGKACIKPCTAQGFVLPNYSKILAANEELSMQSIVQCVNENIHILVQSAIKKSEVPTFNVKHPVCLQVVVFFIKINRLKEAKQCIQENMPTTYSLTAVLPYVIYEVLLTVLVSPTSIVAMDGIAYISTALDRMEDSGEEDRAINAVLVGLSLSKAKRTPSILSMYTQVRLSPHKSSTFFYMLSLYLGPGYATKYSLMGLSMESIQCGMCTPNKIESSKKTLQSIISLESDLVLERTPYDLVLDEYMHCKGAMPDPEITIETGVGEYTTQCKDTLSTTETKAVYKIDESAHPRKTETSESEDKEVRVEEVYTEGEMTFEVHPSAVQITGILIHRPPSDTQVISSNLLSTAQKEMQIMPPLSSSGNKYKFFVNTTCTLKEIYLKYKGRTYSKAVSIAVEVLTIPMDKKIVAHRICIVPGYTAAESKEKKVIEAHIQKLIKTPFSVLSFSPLRIRIPFTYKEKMLYREMQLNWEYVEMLKITEKEELLEVQALQRDMRIRYKNRTVSIDAHQTEAIPKNAAKKIFWEFNDRSKSGEILL